MPVRSTSPSPEPAPADRFEETLGELQEVVERLESGGLGLEASLALFERGVGLARRCRTIVDEAEQRVLTLTAEDDADTHLDATTSPAF
ncbi:MAG: exodeoxyribonuclease VII small subunit [Chloroflexi bacterium]|nr:exodeoxyribonuclease VII small subunit [Chloroflexota bacterium]